MGIIAVLLMGLNCYAQDKILILGDSLTEGYGVDSKYSFPSQLENILKEKKLNYRVINGGVSGSTTASGKSRLKWFIKAKPKLMVLALGANDGLRGIKVQETKNNLSQIIKLAQQSGIKVVLAGMMTPPNYGKEYGKKFAAIYPKLAEEFKVKLIPFLLEGVAGIKELNIEDGIHPNRKGYKIIAQTVFNGIKGLL